MAKNKNFYEVLGVSESASEDDIKRAYRKLVREFHPDRNPGDKKAEARFKEVQEAFDVLSDKAKRENYDRFGTAEGMPDFNGGAGRGEGGFQWGGGFGQQVDPSQVEDFLRGFGMGGMGGFGETLGRGQRTRRAAPRPAATHDIRVPFETAALGGTIPISINERELDVKIPAGVEDGKTLRLQGQAPGGGDLLLKIHIDPHPHFRREGTNLVLTAPISLAEAVLGAKIDVPTLDGSKLTVKVPPGTSSGGRLRLRGKGIKGGDQFVEIKVVVPPSIDAQSRKLMEEFAERNPQAPRRGEPWE
jgi:DnaJ-class molecular chaperone